MIRQCGACQLCCRLLPVRGLDKPANTRCRYQRHGKGCAVYERPAMPVECSLWSCRWLVDPNPMRLPRPDHGHYVVDLMPDTIELRNGDTTAGRMMVLQVWVDPAHREAHRDPALREYIAHLGETAGMAAIIRVQFKRVVSAVPAGRVRGWRVARTARRHTRRQGFARVAARRMVRAAAPYRCSYASSVRGPADAAACW